MLKKIILASMLILASVNVYAEEEHPLGNITGTNIEMKFYDHAFAGAINGAVAWGFLDEGTFKSELKLRKYGQTINANFEMNASKKLVGTISSIGEDSGDHVTTLSVLGVNTKESQITLKINDETIVMSITADKFENNHFFNPTYKTTYKGQEISYHLEGKACYGVSSHFALLILGAYIH